MLISEYLVRALWASAAAFIGYHLAITFAAWYKLRKFPGPFLASFSYLWLAKTTASGSAWKIHEALRAQYAREGKGPFIRIAPDILMFADLDIQRYINSARSRYTRSESYNAFRLDPYRHTFFSTTDDAFHDDVKAKTSAGYTGREVPTLEADIDEQIVNMKNLIRRKYLSDGATSRPIDFATVTNYFTLDTLTKIAYGKEFGYLATDSDMNGYVKVMSDTSLIMGLCSNVPWIRHTLASDLMLKLFGPKPTDTEGVGVLMG